MNDKNETPKIIRLAETDSTNNYLREQCAKARLPEGSLVIADFQTAGKGQVGNSWESEAGLCRDCHFCGCRILWHFQSTAGRRVVESETLSR